MRNWPYLTLNVMAVDACAAAAASMHMASGREAGRMFTIELIRGSSWREPVETIDRRECDTNSLEFVLAEARHWLREIQQAAPARGVTHYRIVGRNGTLIGGPP